MNITKTIKELTGEDAVDMFGGDAENIVEELSAPEHGAGSNCPIDFCPLCEKEDNKYE